MAEKRKAIWVCRNGKCVSAWGGANPGSAEACIVCGTAAGEVAQQPKRKKQRQQKQQEEEEEQSSDEVVVLKKGGSSSSKQQDYAKLRVVDLKKILKERGLPLSGKKADLVTRLKEHDAK